MQRVTQQPTLQLKPQYRPNPYSYILYLSMVNSFCCCFCTGLVAVYYSVKVTKINSFKFHLSLLLLILPYQMNSSWIYGEYQNAGRYLKRAKIWNVVTAVFGLLIVATWVVLVALQTYGYLPSFSSSSSTDQSSLRYYVYT